VIEAAGPSLARRRAHASLHGALLGAWYGVLFLTLVRGTDHGWYLFDASQPFLDRAFGYEQMILKALERSYGVALPGLEVLVPMLIAFGAVSGFLLAALGQALRIDRPRNSLHAMLDIARSWRFLAVWLLAPLVFCLAVVAFARVPAYLVFFCLPYFLFSPFLAWNRKWLDEPGIASVPIPRWPGWRVLRSALIVAIPSILLKEGLERLGEWLGGAWPLLLVLPETALDIATGLLIIAIWVDRFDFVQSAWAQRARLFRWPVFAAFLALQVRISVLVAWLFAPIMAGALFAIWVLPQLGQMLAERGQELPAFLNWLRPLLEYWWAFFLVMLPAITAVGGRLYVRVFPRSLNDTIVTPSPCPPKPAVLA
jgi:hypothetical protein